MDGLTQKEAGARLRKYGPNKIKKAKKTGILKIIASQFASPLIIILIIAALVAGFVGTATGEGITDCLLIIIIVVISAVAGFLQEYKAEKTIEALQQMSAPHAKVIRNGEIKEIATKYIVPEDLVILEEGDITPADGKITEGQININEAIITGESEAVRKGKNKQVFMNTLVMSGQAQALIKNTGMSTKVGKIAEKMQTLKKELTPFQKDLKGFARKITIAILAVTVLMFIVGMIKFNLISAFLIAVSLAVAAIPEALPAVSTLSLAIGSRDMARKKAVIRKLAVVESLGAVDVICTDKTGTLTKNEMEVEKTFYFSKKLPSQLLLCSALCNNVKKAGKKYLGDQTEIAIKKFADKHNIDGKQYKRLKENAFTSERKMMSVVCQRDRRKIMFAKGAPEVIVKKCTHVLENKKIRKITQKDKQKILEQNQKFASDSYRVLAFAFKKSGSKENKLIFIGLEALRDEIRKGVPKAIKECENAGIRTIMVTGDNTQTALAIAKEIGIKGERVIEGKTLDKMSDKKIAEMLKKENIFARVSPFHKLKILEILQKKGKRVAVTGDGVNDALMLKKANVGVSMGIRGSEVAKNASDIILLDDNFATLKTGIKEGRRIFSNIRKFVNYLFTSNFAEVSTIFIVTLLFAFKEPVLLPVHILWINLLTDGMPAVALGTDPASKNTMKNTPRKKGEGIINGQLGISIGVTGIIITAILLATFMAMLNFGFAMARTALFTGLVLYEFVRIATIRNQEKLGFFENKWLVAALVISVALQLLLVYTPLNTYFGIVPLNLAAWGVLIAGVAIGFILSIAAAKAISRLTK